MRQALLDCEEVTEKHLEFFRWPRSRGFDADLENFILAHDLPITIHYARSLPLIDFVDLQNVITEGKAVAIFPTLDQVAACDSSGHRALHIEYETSIPAHIGWSNESQRLEGTWPASLAREFGAERQDGFVMPLGIAAIVINVFPGNVKLERIVRAAVPVHIKRRPDICGGNSDEIRSPTAHECFDTSPLRNLFDHHLLHDLTEAGQAAHGYSFFDQSLPCTPIRVRHARIEHPYFDSLIKPPSSCSTATPSHTPRAPPKRREHFASPLSRTELKNFLQIKANSNFLENPLDLNPLTMASIWDLTAPTDEAREVKGWTMRDTTAERPRFNIETHIDTTPSEVVSSPKTPRSSRRFRQAGRAPLSVTQPRASPKREARSWKAPVPVSVSKSPKRKTAAGLSCHSDNLALERSSSPSNGDLPAPSQGLVSAAPDHTIEQSEHDHRLRRDSVFDFDAGPELTYLWERDTVLHDELFNVDSTPFPNSAGKSANRRRNAMSSDMQSSEDACKDVDALRLFRLLNWRQEPEKLNERDVDLLQQEIQMNYEESCTKTLREMGLVKKMEGQEEQSLKQKDNELTGDEQVSVANKELTTPRLNSATCFTWPPTETLPCKGYEYTNLSSGLSKSMGILEQLCKDEAVVGAERAALKRTTDVKCSEMVSERKAGWTTGWTLKMDDGEGVDARNVLASEM
nr:hypothetical protein B0A51_12657 [Rachicladosporium sp. CCFEE 5018]